MSTLKPLTGEWLPQAFMTDCLRSAGDFGCATYCGIGYIPNDARTKITIVRYNTRIAEVTDDKITLFPSTSFRLGEINKTYFPRKLDYASGPSTVSEGKLVVVTIGDPDVDGQVFTVPDRSEVVITADGVIHLPAKKNQKANRKKVIELRARVRQFFEAAIMTAKLLGGDTKWRYDRQFLDAFLSNDPGAIANDSRVLVKWDKTATRFLNADEIKRAADLFMNRNKNELYEKCGVFE